MREHFSSPSPMRQPPSLRHSRHVAATEALERRRLLSAAPVIDWSTYLGGADLDGVRGVAVDANGSIYAAGWSYDTSWTQGPLAGSSGGGIDSFLVKLNPDGTLAWSRFLGGSSEDSASAVAVDNWGNVYVAGHTLSSGWIVHSNYAGGVDGFVLKINPEGELQWGLYLGREERDMVNALALDDAGNVHVAGETKSPWWMPGGYDTHNSGNIDGFVMKLSPVGARMWGTFVGGIGTDRAQALAVDGEGNVVVAGITSLGGWGGGGWDPNVDGSSDAFVTHLSASGALHWSTYLGGSAEERANGLAVNADGDVYVTGETNSEGWVSGGLDTSFGGDLDAFVAKFSKAGDHLWSSYVGGTGRDLANAVAVDHSGAVHLVLEVSSPDLAAGYRGGLSDAYLLKLNASDGVEWGTYLGGSSGDIGSSIAFAPDGAMYVGGLTSSSDWVSGGFDTVYGNRLDGFVSRIGLAVEVTGTNDADVIDVTLEDGAYVATVNGVSERHLVGAVRSLTIRGLAGDDRITVSAAITLGEAIYAGGGNDTVVGGSGPSSIFGGLGDDHLSGRAGNDLIEGGEGRDSLFGGGGRDTIYGHDGDDRLDGGAGDDELYGNADSDTLFGAGGNDYIRGNTGSNWIYSSDGNDTIAAAGGDDHHLGAPALSSNSIAENAPAGTPIGLLSVPGAAAGDVFTFTLVPGPGSDDNSSFTIAGAELRSAEVFDYETRNAYFVRVQATGPGDFWTESALTVYVEDTGEVAASEVLGTDGDDIIHIARIDAAYAFSVNGVVSNGPVGPVTVRALAGNDLISVGEGVEGITVFGGDGDDTIFGGAGDDLIYGDAGNDVLAGYDGLDTILGNFGDDVLMGGLKRDSLMGGLGNDIITAGDGPDSVYGGDGRDLLRGGRGADYIEGRGKADTILGGDGNDLIVSGAGSDLVFGETGDDILYATRSPVFQDTLDGGDGFDLYEADDDDTLINVEASLLG